MALLQKTFKHIKPCLRIPVVILTYFGVYFAFYTFSCQEDPSSIVLADLGRMMRDLNEFDITYGRVFFFVETSGSEKVSERYVCSLEAAARLNPNVTFLLVMPQIKCRIKREENPPLIRLLAEHRNVQLVRIGTEQLLRGTILQETWRTKFLQTPTPVQHLSVLLRLALLWHFGGVYMDLDVLTVRDLSPVLQQANFLSADGDEHLSSCVMGFERRHPLLQTLLEVVRADYDPKDYSTVPTAINKAVVAFFNVSIKEAIKRQNFSGVRIFDHNSFIPVEFAEQFNLFDPVRANWVEKIPRKSFGVHYWGSLTQRIVLNKNSSSPFVLFARKFCPKTYPDLF